MIDPEDQDRPKTSPHIDGLEKAIHDLQLHKIELEMQNEELRRAQASLSESQSRFFDFYHLSPSGFLTLGENATILEANLSASTMLGLPRSQLIGKPFTSCICPQDQDSFYRFKRGSFQQGVSRSCELRLKYAEKAPLWVQVTATEVEAGGSGRELRVTLSDFTERKAIEASLRGSEANLLAILDATQESIWVVALDGRIIHANSIACKRLGIEREGAIGRNITDLLPPDIARSRMAYIAEMLRSGKPIEDKDEWAGHFFEHTMNPVLDEGGHIVAAAIFSRDVTAWHKAEMELRHSAGMLDTIGKSTPDAIFVKDLDGRMLYASQGLLRIFGTRAESVMGRLDSDWNPKREEALAIMADDRRVMEGGQDLVYEETIADPKGDIVLLTTKSPLMDEHGRAIGVVGLSRDITLRKRAEEETRRALAEKDALLNELFHRTRNNLQVVMALLALARETTKDPTAGGIIQKTSERLLSMALVQKRLYEANDLSFVDLKEYTEELFQILRETDPQSWDRISLVAFLEPVRVVVDAAIPFGLVLHELLLNALRHAFPEGRRGEIIVRLSRVQGGWIHLEVSDNGVGLPADCDIRRKDTLGFQLIHGLVESQMDGRLGFETEVGLTCKLWFPDSAEGARI